MPILTPEERVGTTLADKYKIDRIIGKGGMGVVFGAEHSWTGRQVAVKIIHPALAGDPILAERLLREARTAASLEHPNAVQVLDMGADPDGTVFLVLELLKGESLDDRLKREQQLSFGDTLAIMLPIMNALAVAHESGLVHRDLKPDNIFLHEGPTGVVPTLLDFGIAKVIQEGADKVTQTGVVMGTPHYISPEQAIGESTVGPASDVWAMGVLLFECLSGRMPFEGSTSTKIVMKVVTEVAPKLEAEGIQPLIAARAIDIALEKDLSRRYANMREFVDALWTAATNAGYASAPAVAGAPAGAGQASGSSPPGALYSPADGAAPVIRAPARVVGMTTPMNVVPPVATRAPAIAANGESKPWAAVVVGALVAVLFIGGVSLAGVFLVGNDTNDDDSPPLPTTAAESATEEIAPPTEEPTLAEGQVADGPANTEEAPAETAETMPAVVADAPGEVEAAGRDDSAAARERRAARRARAAQRRRDRAEISSSW